MNREFPFSFAFTAAIILHLVLVVLMRWNSVGASPHSPQARQPVTIRFVEVPPNASTIPQKPDTRYSSDANRKAGAIDPEKPIDYSKPTGSKRADSSSPPPAKASRPADASRQPSAAVAQSELPDAQAAIQDEGTIAAPSPQANNRLSTQGAPQLAQSLRNLDRFIESGTGNGSGARNGPEDSGSGVFFDTQGYDLGPWANRIVGIVRSNWLIPLAAQLGNKGIVAVAFKIDRTGKVFDIELRQPSGVLSFDQAAVNALRSSSPFPPLPADFPRPHLPAVFRFYYNTPVQD